MNTSLEFKDLYLDGTATIDTLTVDEAATIGTTLGVTGATTLSSTLGVTGATTLSSTLGVTGATTLSSTLAVTGTSTLTGNVTASNDLSVGGNLTVTGNATISGNLTFGDADTDSITLTADVASNIVPDVDDTYDLGTATKQWRNLYIDGTAEVDTLSIDGTAVTSTAAELNILDGVTATAAEINTLDGITATVAELNILDGVTSTATELNIMDGDTLATATTLADADRVVVNDAGVMKQVALTDFETYFESALDTLSNVTTVGALTAGSITSGFGAIDNGSSNITTTGTVTYGSLSDGVITITAFADEDDMVSNSATLVPTQQSVKAYVDAQVATANELSELTDVNLTTPADASLLFYDTTTSKWIDNVVSGDITIADTGVAAIGSGVIVNDDINASAAISVSKTALTAGTGLTLSTDTLAIDSTVATLTGTQTLTNKTLTSPVLNTGVSGTAFLDDDTFATATASTLASSESIKAYVDSSVSGISSNSISDADGDTKIQVEESADEDIIRFDTFGTERMVINASGNVGIGTSNPNYKLEINHTGADTTALVLNDENTVSNATGLYLRSTSEGRISVGSGAALTFAGNGGSSEQMRIDSSGNVGIGTDSPAHLLHLSAADPRIQLTDTNTNVDHIINANSSVGNLTIDVDANAEGSSPNLIIDVAGSERMRIDSSGNVGIGTTSPSSNTLSLSGKYLLLSDSQTKLGDNGIIGGGAADGNSRLEYYTGKSFLITQSGTERMRIDSSGRLAVGISSSAGGVATFFGTGTGAEAKVQIEGEGGADPFVNFLVNNTTHWSVGARDSDSDKFMIANNSDLSSGVALTIDTSENVGIGTTSPSTNLHLSSSGSPTFRIERSGASQLDILASTAAAGSIIDAQSNHLVIRTSTAEHIGFETNNSERMRIDSSGNVGIGTSSPSTIFEIINSEANDVTQQIGNSRAYGVGQGTHGAALLLGKEESGTYQGMGAIRGRPSTEDSSLNGNLIFDTRSGGSLTEAMRIDSSGNVGIGESSPEKPLHVSICNTGYTSVTGQTVALFERNGDFHVTIRSNAANHGSIKFADDGNSRGEIRYVHGTSTDEMRFYTAGSESMRIDSNQKVIINNDAEASEGAELTVVAADTPIYSCTMNTGASQAVQIISCERSANSAYRFIKAVSGQRVDATSGDVEFAVRGDGEVTADGSFTGGGADYAEYFEWNDGNSSNEDRVGYSVSLVNGKIKIAESGEEVIGVISGNPSVVGDAAWNNWQDKYLKDDFGRYLWEEYTAADGRTVDDNGDVLKRKVLNPDYDDSLEYQPREDRQEWDVVGLMGKLRVRVGQQTGSNWIKLRDISDTVEEWLVR